MKMCNSKLYSAILFQHASFAKQEMVIFEYLKQICDQLKNDPLTLKFFHSPYINKNEKLCSLKDSPPLSALFDILIGSKETSLLPKILKEYEALLDYHLNREEIIIQCAKPLSVKQQNEIRKKLPTSSDIQFQITPSLLDGFRVYWDDKMLPLSSRDLLHDLSEITR
jgi:F0F1-type ATP synthase delta subunit